MTLHVDGIERQFRDFSFNTLLTLRVSPSDDSFQPLKDDGPLMRLWEKSDNVYRLSWRNYLTLGFMHGEPRRNFWNCSGADKLRARFDQGINILSYDFDVAGADGQPRLYTITALMVINNFDGVAQRFRPDVRQYAGQTAREADRRPVPSRIEADVSTRLRQSAPLRRP